jgi:hypothetical protein
MVFLLWFEYFVYSLPWFKVNLIHFVFFDRFLLKVKLNFHHFNLSLCFSLNMDLKFALLFCFLDLIFKGKISWSNLNLNRKTWTSQWKNFDQEILTLKIRSRKQNNKANLRSIFKEKQRERLKWWKLSLTFKRKRSKNTKWIRFTLNQGRE